MEFNLSATSSHSSEGTLSFGKSTFDFGVTKTSELPSPADLLVAAFAACCLKNIERFSQFMHYTYSKASIHVKATRSENPPQIETLVFSISIHTTDSINTELLLRNLSKHGTIYTTLRKACIIEGTILTEAV